MPEAQEAGGESPDVRLERLDLRLIVRAADPEQPMPQNHHPGQRIEPGTPCTEETCSSAHLGATILSSGQHDALRVAAALVVLLSVAWLRPAAAQPAARTTAPTQTIESPGGTLSLLVRLNAAGEPRYGWTFRGRQVIEESNLGLTAEGGPPQDHDQRARAGPADGTAPHVAELARLGSGAWKRIQRVERRQPPDHETILPFTRLIGGAMDYTPGIFQIRLDYYQPGKKEQVHTTLAKQLALDVTL